MWWDRWASRHCVRLRSVKLAWPTTQIEIPPSLVVTGGLCLFASVCVCSVFPFFFLCIRKHNLNKTCVPLFVTRLIGGVRFFLLQLQPPMCWHYFVDQAPETRDKLKLWSKTQLIGQILLDLKKVRYLKKKCPCNPRGFCLRTSTFRPRIFFSISGATKQTQLV